jgi:hypothetical protein
MSLQNLKEAVKKFDDVRSQFSSSGSQDPESQHVFYRLIDKVLKNQPYQIPDTSDGWDLYDDAGSEEAATALHSAAKIVCDELKNITIKDLNEVKFFLGI